MNLKNKKILLGVTGSIAAYKACSLVNLFLKNGADVRVVMTDSASKFVSPLTFESLAHGNVHVDLWNSVYDKTKVEHIDLANWADLILIAPATANTIAKISAGIADNMLTTIVLAKPQDTKVVFALAMNSNMLENPITKQNIKKLENLNYDFIKSREGMLACESVGAGKIADNNKIIEFVANVIE